MSDYYYDAFFGSNDSNAGESEASGYNAPVEEPVITQAMIDAARYEGTNYTQSEIAMNGTPNTPALISTQMQSSSQGNTLFTTLGNLLGNVRSIANEVGQTVSAVKKVPAVLKADYNNGVAGQGKANNLQLWLATASTTDKLTVAIGLFGVFYLLKKG